MPAAIDLYGKSWAHMDDTEADGSANAINLSSSGKARPKCITYCFDGKQSHRRACAASREVFHGRPRFFLLAVTYISLTGRWFCDAKLEMNDMGTNNAWLRESYAADRTSRASIVSPFCQMSLQKRKPGKLLAFCLCYYP
jgi:hypothetical protein